MVGCSGSPTKRSENFTKLKLIVVSSLKSLEDFRSVTVVTIRFLSLLSSSFGFANLLNPRRNHRSHTLESNNKPTISVLVSNFDQLLSLFDQLCFSNCFRLPSYLMSAAPLSDFALRSNCFLFSTNCEIR